ncbi:MAG: hypothetical protein P4L92_20930 [Rudaea sp.]|nr:hypothetical protein [Rudaea sp.]
MLRQLLIALCAVVFSTGIQAQAPGKDDVQIPSALKDWQPWVLKGLEYRGCPFLASSAPNEPADFICAWPERLILASTRDGATFSIRWRVEAPGWVPLPGDAEHWPQQVSVNAQRQPVLAHAVGDAGEAPALWLGVGNHEISGRIPWREQPQSLAIPASIGLIALSVDGKPVAPVQRDGGEITLGRVGTGAPEADNILLRVYRKLSDGVPAQLSTRIVLAVAGQAREEIIGPALPAGFAPLSLNSTWPARLDGDGRLHVQVQPGAETLVLEAHATKPLTAAEAQLPAAPWPKQEVWSYEAAPRLRVTATSGAVQLDPRQAEVPGDWQMLPAFALGDGARLVIEERSRGLAPDEGNRLSLQREAWLDFSGAGWFARDHIGGNMAQGWRFDVATPFALEQADARNSARDGRIGEPLLVTRGARPELSGVEWRTPNVDLDAGVRIASAAAMPVTGWQQTFDHVEATLHFPFGYKLLGAPGADSAAGSWIAGWTLLDVFVCAILALLAWRLLGLVGVAAMAAYLLLAYQESGSPLWSLLAVLALALIARALPAGKLARAAELLRRAALVLLVLVALPFVAAQVRYAIYPQLEVQRAYPLGDVVPGNYGGIYRHKAAPQAADAAKDEEIAHETVPESAPMPVSPPVQAEAQMAAKPVRRMNAPAGAAGKSQALDTIAVTGSSIRRVDIGTASPVQLAEQIDHYSQTTVVQTGSGAPSWNLGSTAWLNWSGPVVATQSVHLLIAPPWLVRPLRIVLALLLAWLIWRVFRAAAGVRPTHGPLPGTTAVALGLLCLGATALTTTAQAQGYPPDDLLRQLRERVTEAPTCAPACAGFAEAQIDANGDSVSVVLEAHAGERVAVPLPVDAVAVALKGIRVDGAADEAVVRDDNGGLWLTLNRGVHRVQLDFSIYADKVSLAFPLKPARVLFAGQGWEASGLSEEHLLTETLTLARARGAAGSTPGSGVQQFPPYVRVDRSLSLGLEWSTATHVERLSPAQGGFTVEVPVLAGEHVSTSGIKVQNGKVPAAIGDGAGGTDWQSTLDKAEMLTLVAPVLTDRAEVWHVLVSPTWHVEFSGVPGVGPASGDNPDDFRNFEFHPLPGETLSLHITRPPPAEGALRAIDAANLRSEIGQHASTHVLGFSLRASQGGDHVIVLPKGAEVLGVSRNGQSLNLRSLDGKLSLPVTPGVHRYEVRFRDDAQTGTVVRTPLVALGLPAANVALDVQLPADRWLLATSGPPVGPAVLYWGELALMLAVAFALARTQRTRLRFRDWLLLGLGFSTFSWAALLVVVAWLFAFDWRGRGELPQVRWRFNLVQAALVLLTVIALFALASAIPQGLLGQPDMHVAGNGSGAQSLQWFADRSADALPQATAVSLPLWVYKALMLAWALWLANALIGWLRDGFAAWTKDGYWRTAPPNAAVAQAATTPTVGGTKPDSMESAAT